MSTHVVEQLLFSVLPSILTFDFDFDLILGYFLPFWALMAQVLTGSIRNGFQPTLQKQAVLGYAPTSKLNDNVCAFRFNYWLNIYCACDASLPLTPRIFFTW